MTHNVSDDPKATLDTEEVLDLAVQQRERLNRGRRFAVDHGEAG
jgi:hypothetical protein